MVVHWSLDAYVDKALESGKFDYEEIVCIKTLYNYVDAGLMNIKNINQPKKVSRKNKHERIRRNKNKTR